MTEGSLPACSFRTARLAVDDWHTAIARSSDLSAFVMALLTPGTTGSLPPEWQGSYDLERARSWIAGLDADPATSVLVMVDRESSDPLGLVLLFADGEATEPADLRIGYMLLEAARGRGFATEAITGLVEWAAARGTIERLHAGVEDGNDASIRVLRRAGFAELAPRASGGRRFVRTLKELYPESM